jgi:hypothetical protein
MKKRLIIIISVISILLTGSIIYIISYGNFSVESLITNYWKAVNSGNINKINKCFPEDRFYTDISLNDNYFIDTSTIELKKIKDISPDIYNLPNLTEVAMYDSSCEYTDNKTTNILHITFIVGKINHKYYILNIIEGNIIEDDITIDGTTNATMNEKGN